MSEVWSYWNKGAKIATLLVGGIAGFMCYASAKDTLLKLKESTKEKAASLVEAVASEEEDDEEE